MKNTLLPLALLALLVPFTNNPSHADETLPLTSVTLSNAGLIELRHKGMVDDNESLRLKASANQIDDILKSLIILDDKGHVVSVSLPGKAPLDKKLEAVSFTLGDLDSLQGLLKRLRGEPVQIETGGASIAGRISAIDLEYEREGGVARHQQTLSPTYRVSVISGDALETVRLKDLAFIKLENKELRGEFERALNAIQSDDESGHKDIEIRLSGPDDRLVEYSYVVSAPLWKTAYRMVIPQADKQEGFLQSWAILENMSGQDWNDVSLTLKSGTAVAYQQNLYESYYKQRPSLPLANIPNLRPETDQGTIDTMRNMRAETEAAFSAAPHSQGLAQGKMARSMALADHAGKREISADQISGMGTATNISKNASMQTITLPKKLSLAHGHSMMAPIISERLPMELVAYYQANQSMEHPYAAVRVRNESGVDLPAGIITLYDQASYLGDAEMPYLPQNDERMISFALDHDIKISKNQKFEREEVKLRNTRGMLEILVQQRQRYQFKLKNLDDKARSVIIDHPKSAGWKASAPDFVSVEETKDNYRLSFALEAGSEKSFTFDLVRDDWQVVRLATLSQSRINQIAASNPDQQTKAFLSDIAKDYARIDQLQREKNVIERDIREIEQDQRRTRDNLGAIPEQSNLARKYLNKMEDQEDQLQELARKKNLIEAQIESNLNAISKKIMAYDFGQ